MGQTLKISVLDNAILKDKDKNVVGSCIKYNTFREIDILPEQLPDYISTGRILSYLHKDQIFFKKTEYSDENYKGFQVLMVDVDGVPDDPEAFIQGVRYKPYSFCTSYSNKITDEKHPNGENEWRFHLYYAFSEVIYGMDNFYTVFDKIVADFSSYDTNVRTPKGILFTSYRYKPENIQYYRLGDPNVYGHIYTPQDFSITDNKEPDYTAKAKVKVSDTRNSSVSGFPLDRVFMKDFRNLSRGKFLAKYQFQYPYITQTMIDPSLYTDSNGNDLPYADLRSMEFYSVPSAQMHWDPTTRTMVGTKVKKGHRDRQLYVDSNIFMKVLPNPTREHLVYCITKDVHDNYENGYEFTEYDIIYKAKRAWEDSAFNPHAYMTHKRLKTNRKFWEDNGVYDKMQQINLSRKMMTDSDIYRFYMMSTNIDTIISMMRDEGIKTTKKRVTDYLDQNNLPYTTDKEIMYNTVIMIYEKDKTKGYRDIAKMYEQMTGKKTSHTTVKRILLSKTDKPTRNWIAEIFRNI